MRSFFIIFFTLLLCGGSNNPVWGQGVEFSETQEDVNTLVRNAIRLQRTSPDSALFYAKTAILGLEYDKDDEATAEMNVLIGQILHQQGNFQMAIEYLQLGFGYYQEAGLDGERGEILNQMGRAMSDAFLFDASKRYLDEAHSINGTLKDLTNLAQTYCNYGYLYERTNRPRNALDFYYRADSVNNLIRNKELDVTIKEAFGSIYEDLGEYDRAMNYYLEVFPLYEGQTFEKIDVLNNVGDIYRKTGDAERALGYYTEAYDLAVALNASRKIQQNLRDLALTHEALGQSDVALDYWKAHMDIYTDVYEERAATQINLMEILFDTDKKNREIALQRSIAVNRTFQRNAIVIGLLVLTLLSMYLMYSSRRTHKLNATLRRQKEEIEKRRDDLTNVNEELNDLLGKLKNTQEQLVHSEKMAAVGTLAAGIAHEINNPLNFIQGSLHGLYSAFEDKKKELKSVVDIREIEEYFKHSFDGVKKASKIVESLMTFSHRGKKEMEVRHLHQLINDALRMLKYDIAEDTEIIKRYAIKPEIECFPEQLGHVILNVLTNALHALGAQPEKPGKIVIEIQESQEIEDYLSLSIRNTGPHIPDNVLPRIFDPFFTTKDPGKGTGLGLSTSYKIIQDHRGKLTLHNIDEGVECLIRLPVVVPVGPDNKALEV